MCPIFRSDMCIYGGGGGHNWQESLLPSLKRILWLSVSDSLSDAGKCRLYRETFTSTAKRLECSHVKGTIQTQKVQHRQPPHPPRGVQALYLETALSLGRRNQRSRGIKAADGKHRQSAIREAALLPAHVLKTSLFQKAGSFFMLDTHRKDSGRLPERP